MSHVTHWLVAVAQRAGMRVADRREYAEATLEEVWAGVIADTEVPAAEIAETVSAHFQLEPARLAEARPAAMRLVPKDVARGFQIMPLHETDHALVVATADPTNLDAAQAIAFASGRTVEFAVAPPAALQATIDEHYPPETAAEGMLHESDLDDSDVTIGGRPRMELLVLDPAAAALTADEAPHPEIRAPAIHMGMGSLDDVGSEMIRSGVSTTDAVERPPVPATVAPKEASAPTQSAPPTDVAARVLVVDDDPVIRTIARSLLEGEGLGVTEASDGMEALQAIAAGMEFELCILDLNMPNVGGRQVLQEIRSTAATAEMPVIVLTGISDSEVEIELMEAGADDYIRKPLQGGVFLVRVKATLRRAGIDPAIYGSVV